VVRIGILGTANIARLFFGGTLHHARFVAVASRSQERAETFAAEFGLERWYGSYDDLLADPRIDAIYIPLPHHLHAAYSILAARAGKHVLVEKPAALNRGEFLQARDACLHSGVLLMEGMMYRFKAIHARVRDLVNEGRIGRVRHIDFSWCFPMGTLPRSRFRLEAASGGGALNDVGVYGADLLHNFLGPSLHPIGATIVREEEGGVDIFTQALCLSDVSTATLTCGYGVDANYYVVGGEGGSFHVPGSVSGRVVENVLQIHLVKGDIRKVEVFPAENPYHALVEHFAECVERKVLPLITTDETLRNITFLDQIRQLAACYRLREPPASVQG
jgi:predicted dehydrogenase